VGLRNEAMEETEAAQDHVRIRNIIECQSPNIKRPRACLAESGQMESMTNQTGKATGTSCSSLDTDGGFIDEEDTKPSLVTSSAPTGSSPDQEVIQAPGQIPSGWKVGFAI
jgi:hypothetical protein